MAKRSFFGLFTITSGTGPETNNMKFTGGGDLSADPNTLDHYSEGAFLPAMTIGGASTGITYATQSGSRTRIGNRVLFEFNITLSSKGALAGAVEFTGLPFTVAAGVHVPANLHASSLTGGVGDTFLSASILAGLAVVRPYKIAAATGGVAQLTDADITNTSVFRVSGSYPV